MWHVNVPRALRLAMPPMTNDFVSLLKDSSLVRVCFTVIERHKRMRSPRFELRGWLGPGHLCAVMYLSAALSGRSGAPAREEGCLRISVPDSLAKRHGAREVLVGVTAEVQNRRDDPR